MIFNYSNFLFLFFFFNSSCGVVAEESIKSTDEIRNEKKETDGKSEDIKKTENTDNTIDEKKTESDEDIKSYIIVGAENDDLSFLKSCILKFKTFPFPERIVNFNKIKPNLPILSGEKIVDDKETSQNPRLVFIDQAIGAGGEVIFDLLGENSYYCIVPVKGVLDKLIINIECNSNYIIAEDLSGNDLPTIDMYNLIIENKITKDFKQCP